MEPLFAFAAELWWLGPAAIAGGAASFAGLRYGRRRRARTLEYAGARHELTAARARLQAARARAKAAQAALLVAKSGRQSGRGAPGEVEAARTAVGDAQREARAAHTALRGRRVQVKAARALLRGMPRGDEHLPLARLVAEHDAVVARWMAYETDPAKAIAFPTMSDARVPATATLLTAMERAWWLRPRPGRPTLTPEEFARYRAAVTEVETAFRVAEAAAWRAAGAGTPGSDGGGAQGGLPPQVRGAWNGFLEGTRAVAASAAAAAAEAARDVVWRAANRDPGAEGPAASAAGTGAPQEAAPPASRGTAAGQPAEAAPQPGAGAAPPPSSPRRPTWPVPRRSAE
ncbi:hypothetical protein ACIGCK_00315 [Microbacterium sp. NPDC078428]|uniref:hypothetical protein n=1 Tax=Microbacterium sp. NPDC078428 TaxID=3364190 RepID=UPI0037C5FA50